MKDRFPAFRPWKIFSFLVSPRGLNVIFRVIESFFGLRLMALGSGESVL